MLRSIHIENFRALREFRMSGLGRVNLLVGTNNSGKTSVLEAINVLARPGDLRPFLQSLLRRGEIADNNGDFVEIRHTIHGHRVVEGSGFSVRASNDDVETGVRAWLTPRWSDGPPSAEEIERALNEAPDADEAFEPSSLQFRLEWRRSDESPIQRDMVVMAGGGVARRQRNAMPDEPINERVQYISTDGLTRDEVVSLFDRTVLTPDEAVVMDALRTIEPTIERLASVSSRTARTFRRGGIDMLVAGEKLPVGTMGDGIWRLLGVALALVRARGGILLVDEIDTGLHYTVLTKMWRLVFETATRLDVQVFATTHSRDCYEALAEVTDPERREISLQRIERGKAEAVSYREGVLRKAAEHGIEVR